MASFTDNLQQLTTFTPYVQQQPVELMAKVGMAKQEQYNQGIQKIQTAIDNIGGLDIAKDSDRAYLQSKLNELGNNLKFVAAGDFSDFQLVNSVNGMTSQLVKDPNIQNAVASTAHGKKEFAFMEEERKKGNLNPSNEVDFKKKYSQWLNNSEIGQSFNAKYDPFFDVFKYTKETFDALKPDGYSFDQLYETNNEGVPLTDSKGNLIPSKVMKRIEKEGIDLKRTKETLNQIFSDPRVVKQLSIDGRYNLSSLDESQLKEKVLLKKNDDISNYEERLFQLNMEKAMGKKDVSDEIEDLYNAISKADSSYNSLLEVDDPDLLRAYLHKQDVYDRYTKMFYSVKTKEQYLENPLFKINFELNKEENRRAEVAQQRAFEMLKFEREEKWREKQYKLDLFKAETEAKKKLGPSQGNNLGDQGVERAYSTDTNFMALADNKYTEAANNYSSAQDIFIYETLFKNDKKNGAYYQSEIKRIQSEAPGDQPISEGAAINIFLKAQAKAKKMNIGEFRAKWMTLAETAFNNSSNKNNISSKQFDLFSKVQQSKQVYKGELLNKKERDDASIKIINEIGLDEEFANVGPKKVTYRGKEINLSKQDQIDIATYLAGRTKLVYTSLTDESLTNAADYAKRRLDKKGLGDIAERYLQYSRAADTNPITMGVGSTNEFLSNIRDIGNAIIGDETNIMDEAYNLRKLGESIKDKSYSKVIDNQNKIIQNQYNINPNKAFTLSTGDVETDAGLRNQLRTFMTTFEEGGKSQNLATREEFESFKENINNESLNEKDLTFSMFSDIDENGKPVWTVVDNRGGRMVLNPDQSSKIGYNANDIYEANSIMYLRTTLNRYNGSTTVMDPTDTDTYKYDGGYFYDNISGSIPNVDKRKYIVRANVEELDGKYYPYIYVSDGKKEVVNKQLSVDNLSNLDYSIRTLTNKEIIDILNKN